MQFVLKSTINKLTLSLLSLLFLSVLPQLAQANDWSRLSDGRRVVTRAGAWINEAGSYILRYDLVARGGDGIVITASGVTIDLNGFQVETRNNGVGRGILIDGATGVTIKNGRVGSFNANVMLLNSTNVTVQDLQIVGAGLAPSGGPSEIGINIINSRAALIKGNTISSVNLGIFVRGGNSTGNRITENNIVGGAVPANNLLGVCYNPAPNAGTAAPRGDLIYNNHIARFGYAFALSEMSIYNVIRDNTFASFIGGIRETNLLVGNGGTNVAADNIDVVIPMTTLQ
jgi:Periplasmic copper-binding protein (NosD)